MERRVRGFGSFQCCCLPAYLSSSESFALVDAEENVLARCIGRMPGWEVGNVEVCKAMDNAYQKMKTLQRPEDGRRGLFPTLFTGYSMGGGQTVRTILFFYVWKASNRY